jgi:hypothetical protein
MNYACEDLKAIKARLDELEKERKNAINTPATVEAAKPKPAPTTDYEYGCYFG